MWAEPAWVAVADGRLPVWSAGEGDGPLILFVHGWTLDARMWTPQFDALAASHRLAAFDRRGFGRSSAPPDPSAEVDDLMALLDALGEVSAVIVGFSQGARSALAFAVRHPARVRGLILAGAPLPWPSPAGVQQEAVPIDAMRDHALRGDWAGLRALWAGHDLLAMPYANAEASALLADMIADYRAHDLLAWHPALELSQMAVATVAVPTLVVTGACERSTRQAAGDALAATIPGAQRGRIAGADHMGSLSHPDRFNQLLKSFLETL